MNIDINEQLKFEQAQRDKIANQMIKYKLADRMRNNMHISDEFLECLDTYLMQHWQCPRFKSELIDGQIDLINNQISGGAISYNVIYHQCTPALAKKAKELRLSFRKSKPEFNIEPIVLVQIVEQ